MDDNLGEWVESMNNSMYARLPVQTLALFLRIAVVSPNRRSREFIFMITSFSGSGKTSVIGF